MPFPEDVSSLEIDTEVELFEISEIGGNTNQDIFRFSNYNGVLFNANYYAPVPCSIEGVDYTSEGTIPRPKFKISDVDGFISGIINYFGGIEGARLTVRRTLKKFLDTETTADPLAEKPKDIFIISQKTSEVPGELVEFELSADIDFVEEFLPRRICSRGCPWIYRGVGCEYSGTNYFDITNKRVLTLEQDVCAHTVDACQLRFGRNNPLRHGGFPGSRRV